MSRYEGMIESPQRIVVLLVAVGVLTGGACLVLTRAARPFASPVSRSNVQPFDRDAALPDPVPGERFVPYVWRVTDLFAQVGAHLEPRAVVDRVPGRVRLAWDGAARFLQIADDASFGRARLHLEVTADSVNARQVFAGKNFWRVSADGRRWSRAREFEIEPEFLPGVPVISGRGVLNLKGFERYVVEYSADAGFARSRAVIVPGPVWRPGAAGFVRVRGLNARGEMTAPTAPYALRP